MERERGIIQKIEAKTGLIHYDANAGLSQGGGSVFVDRRAGSGNECLVIGVHVGSR